VIKQKKKAGQGVGRAERKREWAGNAVRGPRAVPVLYLFFSSLFSLFLGFKFKFEFGFEIHQ
jgi:hypothetical protein